MLVQEVRDTCTPVDHLLALKLKCPDLHTLHFKMTHHSPAGHPSQYCKRTVCILCVKSATPTCHAFFHSRKLSAYFTFRSTTHLEIPLTSTYRQEGTRGDQQAPLLSKSAQARLRRPVARRVTLGRGCCCCWDAPGPELSPPPGSAGGLAGGPVAAGAC